MVTRRQNSALIALRKHLGLSRVQFAEEIGVNPSRVWQVENREGSFSADRWLAVYDQYRVELAHLGFSLHDLIRGSSGTGKAA